MTHAPTRALPLTDRTLDQLPPGVSAPDYDRGALRPGIVHIGVGGFHRAHQAVYLDELARRGETGWGVVGVGLHSREIGEVLHAQDRLYTVVERAADGDDARVVGVLTRYLYAPDDPAAVLAVLADEQTRLVTLTITGTGYRIDAHTGDFDADDVHVASDLEDPGRPETVFGYLVEALHRRRAGGLAPFTVLSCDNMQHNGSAARTAVVSFARLRDPDLAAWIEEHVAFPSSMVDRITPTTPPRTATRSPPRPGSTTAGRSSPSRSASGSSRTPSATVARRWRRSASSSSPTCRPTRPSRPGCSTPGTALWPTSATSPGCAPRPRSWPIRSSARSWPA